MYTHHLLLQHLHNLKQDLKSIISVNLGNIYNYKEL